MLITFKTKAYANITMFGDVGHRMLEMMEFGTSVPGAIRVEDVPRALENLQKALALIPPLDTHTEEHADEDRPTVSLHTRAIPLLELLHAAVSDDTYVSWE
jgi:hypothetical protein